jgi:uncharacterized membrane protein YedE/YeeE
MDATPMSTWPGWVGGIALAVVMIVHWFGVGRMMAVSGRVTAIVDRLRHGREDESADGEEMTQEELLAAIRAETTARFGAGAVTAPTAEAPATEKRAPQPFLAHPLLFVALAVGGLLGTSASGTPTFTLRSEGFTNLVGGSQTLASVVLVFGGVLVGFGTRMAGGCTSGHGLCGVSRGQKGSLLATCAFFGAGVVTSFALGSIR